MLHKRISFWLKHRLHRIILPILVAITVPTLTASLLLHPAYAATITWDGGGADGTCGGGAGDGNKWSCALNWSGDTLPGAGDAVVFDATSTKNATVDAGFAGTVTSISMNAGYTGTITMARSLTTSAIFTQADGVFTADSQSLTIGTDFSLTGGAFTASSGTMLIGGNFTHSAGTFTHNSGTVRLSGATPTLSGATTFNNFYVATTTNLDVTLTLPASLTTTVLGTTRLLASTHNTPADNKLTIVSSSSGVQTSVDFQGTLAMFAAHVTDVNNVGASQIHCYSQCIDNGNNTNVRFGEPGFVITQASNNVTEAGATATFTVALRGKPTANVTIPVSASDSTEASVSPASLVFTSLNYVTPQTVTVTGVDDTTDDGGIASSIVLAVPTSADTLYGVLNPVDVSLFTEDDDQDLMTVDFDNSATLTEEDVKGTVAWFDRTDQGEGVFRTGDGGSAVSLTGTKILPGCRATVGGVDYRILRVSPITTGQALLTDGITSPDQIYLTLVDSAVSKIVCTTEPVDTAQLGGSTSRISVGSLNLLSAGAGHGGILADETNGRIWLGNAGVPALIEVSMATGLEVARKSMTSYSYNFVLDPTRNRLWFADYNSNKLVAFDAGTGDYAFGTLGASSFTVSGHAWDVVYNPDLDEIWVATLPSSKLIRVNSANGAVIDTVVLGIEANGIVYDSIQHAVWISGGNTFSTALYKFSATTGTFANGTLLASTYPIPGYADSGDDSIRFDATRNTIWVLSAFEADGADPLVKVDAATGNVLASYDTGTYAEGLDVDTVLGRVYVGYSNVDLGPPGGESTGVIVFDADTGDRLATYPISGGLLQFAFQSNNTLWSYSSYPDNELDQLIIGASPAGKYYTTLTTASSNLDFAGTNKMASAVASESLDGGNAYYTISFNARQSFKVFSGGWRTVASSLATDHGGVNGNWYYRNDASAWSVAPTNTSAEAISLAVENGATNNRMTGTNLSGISPGNWANTGGFSTTTANLDLAVTLEADSVTSNPAVDSVVFTLAGEGSSVAQSVTNASVSIADDETCTPTADTSLHLVAANASSVRVSNEPFAVGDSSEYISFVADENIPITPSASGSFIRTMTLPWTLSSGDGEKTVYAQFRTATGGVSSEVSDTITLSAACSVIPPVEPVVPVEPPAEPAVPPVLPAEPVQPTVPLLEAGSYVRTASSSAVYYISADGLRRPFYSATEFFTYEKDFSQVRVLADEELRNYPIGKPMPPKPGVVLLKMVSSPDVYAFDPNATIDNPLIHLIPTEILAVQLFDTHWADYIIDLDPTAFVHLTIGDPLNGHSTVDATHLMRRVAIVERIASFLRSVVSQIEGFVMNLFGR
ncbi:MAG: hypothetical protein WC802_04060 [Patescibacteria group bacterium]|jgi:hypothetical protein